VERAVARQGRSEPPTTPGVPRTTSRQARRARRAVEVPDDLSAADAALLASLKSLRGTLAREQRVPAYCVFPDRTLVEMSVRRPRSIDALGQVRGVGRAKLEKYGERFLAAIREGDGTEAA
jgi:ATP-dependent DNA helicase RecQ